MESIYKQTYLTLRYVWCNNVQSFPRKYVAEFQKLLIERHNINFDNVFIFMLKKRIIVEDKEKKKSSLSVCPSYADDDHYITEQMFFDIIETKGWSYGKFLFLMKMFENRSK